MSTWACLQRRGPSGRSLSDCMQGVARLQSSGAVLIEGPKACGKTETARQQAATEIRLDVDVDRRVAAGAVHLGPCPPSRRRPEGPRAVHPHRIGGDQPAWAPAMRSRVQLRSSPRRHFVDPSMARVRRQDRHVGLRSARRAGRRHRHGTGVPAQGRRARRPDRHPGSLTSPRAAREARGALRLASGCAVRALVASQLPPIRGRARPSAR